MFNSLSLTGRLASEPISRVTTSNQTVTNITVAVERNAKADENGDRPVDFIAVAFFGETAELVARWSHKGDLVGIEGSVRTNKRTVGGENRYELGVIGNRIHFLAKNKSAVGLDETATSNDSAAEAEDNDLVSAF
jgi:single-strand DNA-binding protein